MVLSTVFDAFALILTAHTHSLTHTYTHDSHTWADMPCGVTQHTTNTIGTPPFGGVATVRESLWILRVMHFLYVFFSAFHFSFASELIFLPQCKCKALETAFRRCRMDYSEQHCVLNCVVSMFLQGISTAFSAISSLYGCFGPATYFVQFRVLKWFFPLAALRACIEASFPTLVFVILFRFSPFSWSVWACPFPSYTCVCVNEREREKAITRWVTFTTFTHVTGVYTHSNLYLMSTAAMPYIAATEASVIWC